MVKYLFVLITKKKNLLIINKEFNLLIFEQIYSKSKGRYYTLLLLTDISKSIPDVYLKRLSTSLGRIVHYA